MTCIFYTNHSLSRRVHSSGETGWNMYTVLWLACGHFMNAGGWLQVVWLFGATRAVLPTSFKLLMGTPFIWLSLVAYSPSHDDGSTPMCSVWPNGTVNKYCYSFCIYKGCARECACRCFKSDIIKATSVLHHNSCKGFLLPVWHVDEDNLAFVRLRYSKAVQ